MAAGGPGSNPPPKPWERVGNSGGSTPFRPPSSGSTSEVVEASGTAKAGEIVSNTSQNVSRGTNTLARPVPPRPWEQNSGTSHGSPYNLGFGSGYNSYGGSGGLYGGGLYGSGMYRGYGGLNGGFGPYGGNMYNAGLGPPMGAYGFGIGGPYGNQDPNNPNGPSPAPGFWVSLLRVMQGVVNVFGRISVLVDQNTQALHMFMSALLQLFDRSGILYGELARFVLRLLGLRTKPRHQGHIELSEASDMKSQNCLDRPKDAGGPWDNVWGASA